MRFALLLSLTFTAAAQRVEYRTLREGLLQEHLRLAHPENAERFRRLKKLFEEYGCTGDSLREQKVKGSKEPNLICTVPGTGASPQKIVVGAHFDTDGGDGVIDNWSGAVMLPALVHAVRAKPHRHTFEFVGFAAEEQGLLGSRAYLKATPKAERKQIGAALMMDCLGLGPTKCWVNGSAKDMVIAAARAAAAVKVDLKAVNVDRVGTSDSAVFKEAQIPVLSLHSITQETWEIVNSRDDIWEMVSWKDYYASHQLIAVLVEYLDATLP